MNLIESTGLEAWQRRKKLLGSGVEEAERLLEETAGEEQVYLRYILATLPATDLAEYSPELFVKILRQAEKAREDFSWCRALSPRDFLLYVAYPRVNDEELSDCREQFREELTPRIRGLTVEDAMLEVNRWCAENVTYRLTDERTNSAAEVYRLSYGRCGEESLFAVTALRSVGIAARQVYCPWWSHCDDNHAWVEAFDGERWRYFGACEPEPVLDRGWFGAAAARAMVLHTRLFTGEGIPQAEDFFGVKRENFTYTPGIGYELVTQRYADTSVLTVKAENPDGSPVSGAGVVFSVLNMGAFLPVGEQHTGADGTAKIRLGSGSVKVFIFTDNGQAEALLENPKTDSTVTLRLGRDSLPESFAFIPPIGGGRNLVPLTLEQKVRRREELERAARMRAQKGEGAVLPSPEEPIDLEPLRSWAQALKEKLGTKQLQKFSAHPESVWPWVLENHKLLAGPAAPQATPSAVLRLGAGALPSLRVLACGILRCAGVPVRLAADKTVEYRREGAWCSAGGAQRAKLVLQAGESPVTVSRLEDRETRLFTVDPGETGTVALTPGRYRLMAVTRVPSGAQLARQQVIELKAGEAQNVTLEGREADVKDLFTRYALPELNVKSAALVCYVEPGSEPTEHLLGELKEVRPQLEALGCAVKILQAEDHAEAAEELARRVFNEPGRLPLALLCEDDTCIYSCAGYNVGTGELLVRLLKAKSSRRDQDEI